MRILSLGWGTQSFALAAMAALGDIEPLDFAIHADTTHERTATYVFAERWTPWLKSMGVGVVTSRDEYAAAAVYQHKGREGETHLPLFTQNENGDFGQLRRSCTQRWKIAPMRRSVSIYLKGNGTKKTPGIVQKLLGISLDEFQRIRNDNDVKYEVLEYPLIDKRMTRNDCILYLERHGLEVPPRSACVFCPFQRPREWRFLKDIYPEDWNKAVEVDALIRKARPPYDLYICDQRKPLPECDFSTQEDHGQLSFEFCESGHCWV